MIPIPFRPAVLEHRGAIAFWEDVTRIVLEVPDGEYKVAVRLLPVGWSDTAAVISKVIRLRWFLAETHRYFLPSPENVQWNLPLILPRALEALTDPGKLPRTPILDPIGRWLTEVLGCCGKGLEDTVVGALSSLGSTTTCDCKSDGTICRSASVRSLPIRPCRPRDDREPRCP